ncbi:hypothetical protein [Salisaeta icosahedral phage 1]|uniref:hypothetical protein n=1 Tax=Salisaeta icosahedral phage 1 TaxID=1183239 RepID=UPI00025EA923|nr:hypothetical protein A322_gp22 [Salisaeta icosahedral phage 1]AFJ21477.1 hypothetical protein [Salisaeta icosahedral phage 1]
MLNATPMRYALLAVLLVLTGCDSGGPSGPPEANALRITVSISAIDTFGPYPDLPTNIFVDAYNPFLQSRLATAATRTLRATTQYPLQFGTMEVDAASRFQIGVVSEQFRSSPLIATEIINPSSFEQDGVLEVDDVYTEVYTVSGTTLRVDFRGVE